MSVINFPTLTTQRLTLRCPVRSDFEAYCSILTSERAVYMDPSLDASGAWLWFVNDLSGWVLDNHGMFSVTETASEDIVGFVSITKLDRFPEVELGWMITAHAEGKGFAFEAASAVRDWAFDEGAMSTLVSYIDRKNLRSIKLAERMSATADEQAALPEGETAEQTVVYRHMKGAA